VKRFAKGSFINTTGVELITNYGVMKGCVRKYIVKGDRDCTIGFLLEGDTIQNCKSNQYGELNFMYQCMEDTILSTMNEEHRDLILDRFPFLHQAYTESVEIEMHKLNLELAHYISSTPEERYLHLLSIKADLFNRVPAYYIASYLGIKPESLSRIRRRIFEKQKLHLVD
ncbi:MAG: hypothetical protein AAGK97_13045, partial [Bacteroidota bacterium]